MHETMTETMQQTASSTLCETQTAESATLTLTLIVKPAPQEVQATLMEEVVQLNEALALALGADPDLMTHHKL